MGPRFRLSWGLRVAVDVFEIMQIAGGESGSIIVMDCMVIFFFLCVCDMGLPALILGSSGLQSSS